MPIGKTEDRGDPGGRAILLLAPAAACGLILRAFVLIAVHTKTGLPVSQIVAGHDASEYLRFAEAAAKLNIDLVPPDARRHAPGWPALIALFSWAGPLRYIAVSLSALFTAAVSIMTGMLFIRAGATYKSAAAAAFAVCMIYPTQVYFGIFVLTEPLFTFLILLTLFVRSGGAYRSSYALAGACMLVRAPGLLLVVALVAHDLWRGRRFSLLLGPIAILPWLAWGLWSQTEWGADAVRIHEPKFGLPFSGFAGALEIPPVRVAYVLLSVLAFLAGTGLLIRNAVRDRLQNDFLNTAALFCVSFMLFHLCISTLNYLGRTIWTFNYQDRYYVPLLPLCLWPIRSWLRWWWIAVAAVCSGLLSIYWAGNYFNDLLS